MKHRSSCRAAAVLLSLLLLAGLFAGLAPAAEAADEIWTPAPTGYTCAEDVAYVWDGNRLANWGVREEQALFLTTYALDYYTGDAAIDNFTDLRGGTGQSDAHNSTLYHALQTMLSGKQTYTSSYDSTKNMYKYTDCMVNDYSHISSFYSGIKLNGAWDSGATWNREHTWPQSKISGSGKSDIMMLRPTSVKENSSRGNTAYGQSPGYYDPNSEAHGQFNLRGDCARIVLYVYVRWGVTNTMWGQSGVIENLDVLLAWMYEDPVDTWEMGRNDAVQAITGVRNVFVDYPEMAWLLFSQTVPADYPTPSNGGVFEDPCANGHDYVPTVMAPSCTEGGYTIFTCSRCGDSYAADETVPLGHDYTYADIAPTCTEDGYTAYTCARCSDSYTDNLIPALGHDWDEGAVTAEPTQAAPGEMTFTCTRCGETRTEAIPFRFDDVRDEKAFYFNAVYWALLHDPQITKGTSDTAFSPGKTCSRAEVVTFLWRAKGCPEPTMTEHPFTDVKAGAYYEKAVLWALEAGITQGTSDTTFGSSKGCTRGQVVTFLWRAEGCPEPQSAENPFTDLKLGASYYTAVLWAVEQGITNGATPTTFNPGKTCTRGQIVTFLFRAFAEAA